MRKSLYNRSLYIFLSYLHWPHKSIITPQNDTIQIVKETVQPQGYQFTQSPLNSAQNQPRNRKVGQRSIKCTDSSRGALKDSHRPTSVMQRFLLTSDLSLSLATIVSIILVFWIFIILRIGPLMFLNCARLNLIVSDANTAPFAFTKLWLYLLIIAYHFVSVI